MPWWHPLNMDESIHCKIFSVAMYLSFEFWTCSPYFQLSYFPHVHIQGVQNVTKSMAYLESVFPGRLIPRRLWPPRPPDLSPTRLLFMGASQGYCVFISSTHTLQELQTNVQRTVDRISTGTLQNVFANMIRRVHLCEERNGGHIQHLL
jgi:hypothetical protein